MNIRYGLLGGAIALTAVAALAARPSLAGQQEVSIVEANAEDSLLGLKLIKSTYRDVLRLYGQPSEIQAGGPYAPTPPPSKDNSNAGGGMRGKGGGPMSGGMSGGMTPGMGPGMGGGGPMSGGGPGMGGGGGSKKQTSKNGFPNSQGGGAGKGGPGSGGAPGMGGPMSGGKGMGGPMSGGPGMGPGGPMTGGGGLPGFGPNSPGMGGPGMQGAESEGEGGMGAGTESDEDAPVKETTWWYHDHQNGLHIAFVFNRVGEIVQIGEYGSRKIARMHGALVPSAGATRRGLVLGNSMGSVIGKYGFSLDGAHDGDNVILRFGHRDKIAFQMVSNTILGITIGVTH